MRVDGVLESEMTRLASLPFCAAALPAVPAGDCTAATDLLAAVFPDAGAPRDTADARYVATDERRDPRRVVRHAVRPGRGAGHLCRTLPPPRRRELAGARRSRRDGTSRCPSARPRPARRGGHRRGGRGAPGPGASSGRRAWIRSRARCRRLRWDREQPAPSGPRGPADEGARVLARRVAGGDRGHSPSCWRRPTGGCGASAPSRGPRTTASRPSTIAAALARAVVEDVGAAVAVAAPAAGRDPGGSLAVVHDGVDEAPEDVADRLGSGTAGGLEERVGDVRRRPRPRLQRRLRARRRAQRRRRRHGRRRLAERQGRARDADRRSRRRVRPAAASASAWGPSDAPGPAVGVRAARRPRGDGPGGDVRAGRGRSGPRSAAGGRARTRTPVARRGWRRLRPERCWGACAGRPCRPPARSPARTPRCTSSGRRSGRPRLRRPRLRGRAAGCGSRPRRRRRVASARRPSRCASRTGRSACRANTTPTSPPGSRSRAADSTWAGACGGESRCRSAPATPG